MLLRYTTRTKKSRRLDSHQHDPAYETDAYLVRATSAQHEREESNPVRQLWRLTALARSTLVNRRAQRIISLRPANNYFSNSTFQYASLTNFDQLAIRTECRA